MDNLRRALNLMKEAAELLKRERLMTESAILRTLCRIVSKEL